jgi:hypothetical protein
MQTSIHVFLAAACLFVPAVPVQSQAQTMKPFAPGIDRLLAEVGLQIEWGGRDLQATDDVASLIDAIDDDALANMLGVVLEDENFMACNNDTNVFLEDKPELLAVMEDYIESTMINMEVQGDDILMTMEYPDSANAKLKEACDAAGAYYEHTTDTLACTYSEPGMGDLNANIKGLGNCVADTEACRQLDIFVAIGSMFETIGMACEMSGASGAGSSPLASAGTNTHSALGVSSLTSMAFGAAAVAALV